MENCLRTQPNKKKQLLQLYKSKLMPSKRDNCIEVNIIYETQPQTNGDNKVYIGLRANQLRKRIAVYNYSKKEIEKQTYPKFVNAKQSYQTNHTKLTKKAKF